MSELLHSGWAIDVVLAVVAAEAAFLFAFHRRTGRGLSGWDVVGQFLAGALLLLSLRSALTGADARWTLAFLTAAFPAQLYDLARRWRRTSAPGPAGNTGLG